ncbi:hypothetical protein [Vagococcus intermedius]|uniref:Galactose-1-phosphate uridyl transferase N-terminal domain-containing protein n=1 Tax=Vagococcus intermedius TaxID=2991418 RepID=A0AAF0I6P1_9ENTE|nr:hypothetical protein [Vagococcus intermedius]WEG72795.1 hypothetical protein OL234_07335 [Vagococcus intermedius]WEG74880.1 hypothetical protein OL235_07330 [Vagococcus intermedius]
MLVSQLVEEFMSLAIKTGGWMEMDRLYLKNRLLGIIEEPSFDALPVQEVKITTGDVLTDLVEVLGEAKGIVGEELKTLEMRLAEILTPPPSVVNAIFAQRYEKDPIDATHYFYDINQANHFVMPPHKTELLAETDFGTWRFAPVHREARLADAALRSYYPVCLYCMENEGYEGHRFYPSRQIQRMIRMNLLGETWNYQFEPHSNLKEGCIFTSEHHDSMPTGQRVLEQLLALADIFPHYFIGAEGGKFDAEGSDMVHGRYVGGYEASALKNAKSIATAKLPLFSTVTAELLAWPVSTLRLSSSNGKQLVQAAHYIMASWDNRQTDVSLTIGSDQSISRLPMVMRKIEEVYHLDIFFVDLSKIMINPLDLMALMGNQEIDYSETTLSAEELIAKYQQELQDLDGFNNQVSEALAFLSAL